MGMKMVKLQPVNWLQLSSRAFGKQQQGSVEEGISCY